MWDLGHAFTSVKPSWRISSKFALAKQASILHKPTDRRGSQRTQGRAASSGHDLFLLLPKTKSWSSSGTAFIVHMCSLLLHTDSWAKVKACTGHAREGAAGGVAGEMSYRSYRNASAYKTQAQDWVGETSETHFQQSYSHKTCCVKEIFKPTKHSKPCMAWGQGESQRTANSRCLA